MYFQYIRQNLLLVFIAIFSIFYVIVYQKNITLAFFMMTALLFAVYTYLNYKQEEQNKNSGVNNFIHKLENMVSGLNIDNAKIYKIHKSPEKLKYISKNEDIKNMLYDLRPMITYDKGAYLYFITYLEYFLKFHYYVMIERYNYNEYLPIIKDIRKEMLNITKSFTFNSPDLSLVAFDNNIQKTLEKNHNFIKAFTYKYIMILKHKFDKHHQDNLFTPPWEYNFSVNSFDEQHMLY
jgi:Ca2+/Na+ antiporter